MGAQLRGPRADVRLTGGRGAGGDLSDEDAEVFVETDLGNGRVPEPAHAAGGGQV